MKGLITLALLSLTLTSQAATMREKKIKEVMLDRVEDLSAKVASAREDLKKEDVVSGCKAIKDIFKLYPDHVNDVGVRLDPFEHKCAEIRNDALSELIVLHRELILCNKGENSEYVDPKVMEKNLKSLEKSLKRQKKVIEKNRTSFENNFHYDYEF